MQHRRDNETVTNVNRMGHSEMKTESKLLCPVPLGLVAGSLLVLLFFVISPTDST